MTGIEIIGELSLLGCTFVFFLVTFFSIWTALHKIEKGIRRAVWRIRHR